MILRWAHSIVTIVAASITACPVYVLGLEPRSVFDHPAGAEANELNESTNDWAEAGYQQEVSEQVWAVLAFCPAGELLSIQEIQPTWPVLTQVQAVLAS